MVNPDPVWNATGVSAASGLDAVRRKSRRESTRFFRETGHEAQITCKFSNNRLKPSKCVATRLAIAFKASSVRGVARGVRRLISQARRLVRHKTTHVNKTFFVVLTSTERHSWNRSSCA